MTIIKIEKNDNGSHNNQTMYSATPQDFPIQDGWAVVPDGMKTPNFPFGDITVETIDGVPTVTSWTPLPMPEPEPEPEQGPTETEQLRADVDFIAAMTGVQL